MSISKHDMAIDLLIDEEITITFKKKLLKQIGHMYRLYPSVTATFPHKEHGNTQDFIRLVDGVFTYGTMISIGTKETILKERHIGYLRHVEWTGLLHLIVALLQAIKEDYQAYMENGDITEH